VTSTYLEGNQNELAAYGYNRDKKQGKLQIVYGLLTDREGIPLAVEAFKGNTKDNKTLLSQIAKIKERFGVKYVTLVGDKGMIKSVEIEAINEEEKFNYITSITKPQILKLLKRNVIAMELFDEKLGEVFDQQEGLRYILRRNPHRVEEMKWTRESKLSKVKNKVACANRYLSEHPRAKVETQIKNLRKYLHKLRLAEYVEVVTVLAKVGGGGDGPTRSVGIDIEIDQDKFNEVSKLDGCYVIKTNLNKSKNLSKEVIHERYKALSEVEWAFRTQKTGYLEVRPIFVRKETRTRGHLLITMLSYRLEQFLRKCWKDIDLTVEEGIKKLTNNTSVIIKVRSEKLHRVPKPDKLSEQLLNAVQAKLPGTLPLIENGVDTKTKLQNKRK
jgi:transposase